MGYSADKTAYNSGINTDISTQTTPNSIPPEVVGAGYTDLADLLEPYINSINNQALLFGPTVPSNALGVDLDLYFRQANPIEIYRKISGVWVLQGTLPLGFTLPEGNLTVRASIDGFVVTATKGGWVISNTVYQKNTQTQLLVDPADLNFGRIDNIYANTSNNILYQVGIASSTPVAPILPANTILIDQVIVPASSSGNDPYLLFGGGSPSDGETNFANSTGLITGGVLTINADPTKFDVSQGSALFVDYTTPIPPTPPTVVNFGPLTGLTVTNLGSSISSYIGIDGDQVIHQQVTPFTPTQRRSIATLGILIHSNLTVINAINTQGSNILSPANQLHDFIEAIGPLNLSGNKYSSASTNLTIQKTAGSIFKFGCNSGDYTNPHQLNLSAGNPVTFRYRTRNGVETADTTNIIPGSYDNAGTITAVGANQWTNQHITVFQSGLTRLQYGQNLYGNSAEALAASLTEPFAVEANIAANGIFRCILTVRGAATNLSITTDAIFSEVPKFGGSVGNAGSALTAANIIAALGYTPVDGPPTSTDNAIARYDGTNGNTIQDSSLLISDSGILKITNTPPSATVGTDLLLFRDPSSGEVQQGSSANLFIQNQNSIIQNAKFDIGLSGHVGGLGMTETFVSPTLNNAHQGYAWDGTSHYIIHTTRIDKRNNDGSWSISLSNTTPFSGLTGTVNHLGDGDYFSGKLYIPVENFVECGTVSNQKVVTYNSTSLAFISEFDISAQGHEASGIAIDGANNRAYIGSYCDGSKLWIYDATTFSFIGVLNFDLTLQFIQGVSFYNDYIYISTQFDGLFKCEIATGQITFLQAQSPTYRFPEGIAVVSGQVRWLIDNIGDGSNANVHFLDVSASPQGFYTDKSGLSYFGSNLKVGNKLSIKTDTKIGSLNINNENATKIYLEHSLNTGSIGSIGHDENSTFITKNAFHDGIWNRPDITKNSYGYMLNDSLNRHEWRVSKAASGVIIWNTPVFLNLKGDLNLRPDLIQESNGQTLTPLDIQPTFSTGGFTAGANYGARIVADTINGLLVRNPNNLTYSAVSIQDNASTRFMEIGIKGSASTSPASFGATSEGFIRSSGAAAGLAISAANGSIRFLTSSSGTLRAHIDSSGNFFLDTTPSTATSTALMLYRETTGEIRQGALILPIRTITATATINVTDYTVLADATSGNITINLPTAAGASGSIFNVKRIVTASNTITIDPSGAELIDGASTFNVPTLNQNIMFQSNGTAWFILEQ